MTAQNLDGFMFWSEPSDMEVVEGLSVVVGGGEGRSGEAGFLGIITPHSNARVLLDAVRLTMLIDWLTEVRDALGSDGAS